MYKLGTPGQLYEPPGGTWGGEVGSDRGRTVVVVGTGKGDRLAAGDPWSIQGGQGRKLGGGGGWTEGRC